MSEGSSFGSSPKLSVSVDLKVEDLDKRSTSLADETKKLSRLTVSCGCAVSAPKHKCTIFRTHVMYMYVSFIHH